MTLTELLSKKHDQLVSEWFEVVLQIYPTGARHYLRNCADTFGNPVGSNFFIGLSGLLSDLVSGECSVDRLRPHVDRVVRILAVQETVPSRALGFVVALKDIVYRTACQEWCDGQPPAAERQQLDDLNAQIDQLAVLAHDVYTACREQLAQLRAREAMRLAPYSARPCSREGETHGADTATR